MMVDPRAICIGLAVCAGAAMSGVALGNFVTGDTRVAWYRGGGLFASDADEARGNPDAAFPDPEPAYAYATGPTGPVVCKGCGPGINERRMGGYAYGYDDAVVRAYLAREADYRADFDLPDSTVGQDDLRLSGEHDAGPLSRTMAVEPAGQRATPASAPAVQPSAASPPPVVATQSVAD